MIDGLGGNALAVWKRMGEQLRTVAEERVARARLAEVEARQLLESCQRDVREAEADLARLTQQVGPAQGTTAAR